MKVLILLLLLLSCATTKESEESLNYSLSPKFKTDSIMTFALIPDVDVIKGEANRFISGHIKESIYNKVLIELLKVPYFDIIDRKDIDKVLDEQEFSHSGFVGDYAPKVGKILGAKTVGYFSILDAEKVGYPIGSGTISLKIKATVGFKVLDVETGRVLYQAVATHESDEEEEAFINAAIECIKPLQNLK
ncbi:MAG: CsgG/HfaB family protein [candidate division WOR-3 bacterium]